MDDVIGFERRLIRTAGLRTGTAASPELEEIFRRVAIRRESRLGIPGPAAVDTGAATSRIVPAGRVASVEDVAPDVRIIRVGRPAGLQFRAGQYVKVGVPGRRRGSYSIASAPHEPFLEFCIELIPGGRLTPALFALHENDEVTVTQQAKGRFVFDEKATCHLMVATVTGIAPLRSIVRDVLHRGIDAQFVVLHGASHADELPYFAELTELASTDARVEYRATVSRPDAPRNAGWPHEVGRVDDLACRVASGLDPRRTRVYACGHPEMVKRVAGELGAAFAVSTEVFD
jgi:NAD(P)H-flavin reductase